MIGTIEGAGPVKVFSPEWYALTRHALKEANRLSVVGDREVDDTAAFQRALDDLVKHEKFCVFYLPAGRYRLMAALKTVRQAHTDCQGAALIGQHPARTILVWDGPEDGTMVEWDGRIRSFFRLWCHRSYFMGHFGYLDSSPI